MTNEQGYLDIPVDFLDSLFFIKDEYHYATTQITKYDKNQKERTVKLNKATKGKSRNYLSNNCLKISAKLLSEYPHNKILQNFISCLKSQDIIIAKLPENEIVEF